MSRLFVEQIEQQTGTILTEAARKIFFSAILLHDLGHGPFSHAFERVSGEDHEDRTEEILTDEDTEIRSILADCDKQLPAAVRDFQSSAFAGSAELPRVFKNIHSSQLDADRFDYLLRDSYAAGVNYGSFEHNWLISHLYVAENERLYLGRKALLAAEAYVFARHHMYQIVYFHKTTRSAEAMFRAFLSKYKALVKADEDLEDPVLKTEVPVQIRQAFKDDALPLRDYLFLDDHSMTQLMKISEKAKDDTFRELGSALLNRRLFKCVEGPPDRETLKVYEDRLMKLGMDPNYFLLEDKASDTPYKTYDPDSSDPASLIMIENNDGKLVDLSSASEAVSILSRKKTMYRLYFHEKAR